MHLFIFCFAFSICIASEIEVVGYDWLGHFGHVNHNGSFMWNQDWQSGPFFFDGTWNNNPGLMGPNIRKNFNNHNNESIFTDTSSTNFIDTSATKSSFQYNEGDFFQDEFSTMLRFNGNSRNIQLNAYKRSFAGKYNQYTPINESPRPIHQTYTIDYQSKKRNEYLRVAIGQFNTFSGIPDTVIKAYYKSNISSNNLFWSRTNRNFESRLIINNFLQMLHSNHSYADSLSLFEPSSKKRRYLTRSRYIGELRWKGVSNITFFSKIEHNSRGVDITSSKSYKWQNIEMGIYHGKIKIGAGVFSHVDKNKFIFDFLYQYKKNNKNFDLFYNNKPHPTHPFYKAEGSYLKNGKFGIVSGIDLRTINFQFWGYTIILKSDRRLAEFSTSMVEKNSSVGAKVDIKFYQRTKFLIQYKYQDAEDVISDGIKNKIILGAQTKFFIIKGILDIHAEAQVNGWFNRQSSGFLHPVEGIPINIGNKSLKDLWFFSTAIKAQISNFSISYTWKGLIENTILKLSNVDSENFSVHPFFPEIGRQSHLSVKWNFLD